MKGVVRVILFVLVFSLLGVFSACSKKSAGFKYPAHRSAGASSYDPVARKSQPVRKKFIINARRESILGHKKPL